MVDWICSEMHFELMEADSCLTILQSDVVVGEKGPGRNVKRSADSLSAGSWESGSISISLSIDLFISVFICFRGSQRLQFSIPHQVHVRQSDNQVLFQNERIK